MLISISDSPRASARSSPPSTVRTAPPIASSIARLAAVVLTLLLAAAGLAPIAGAAQQGGEAALPAAAQARLAQAQERLDAEDPEGALESLRPVLKKHGDQARPWLLRSTARVMLGELAGARSDLEKALELDPRLRQGWLNLAGLALAEQRHGDALEAFRRAEALDPAAADNHLNIGAVLLLQGQLEQASERFSAYLATPQGGTGSGYYLVATNYALAGYSALAVEHLKRAVELEERLRVSARSDGRFSQLHGHPQFQQLLSAPPDRPPLGSYVTSRTFEEPYRGGRGLLLKAVLDTLQLEAMRFDSQVEVTPGWALIRGTLRILVTGGEEEGQGRVEVSADPEELSPTQWREQTRSLFNGIERQLLLRGLR